MGTEIFSEGSINGVWLECHVPLWVKWSHGPFLAPYQDRLMYGDRLSAREYQEDIQLSDPTDRDQPMQLTQNKPSVEIGEILSELDLLV